MGPLKPAKRLDDGRLVADALITRPGVFEYMDAKYPGGVRRELRPDDEVYSRDTMDSFAVLPITAGHPPKLLTSETSRNYMVGQTGEKATRVPVSNSPDWVKTSIVVHDKKTINRMDKDDATSVGYYCRIEQKSGVDPKYGRFDVIQRDIRGNHLAVAIPDGRAGELARVRMDSSNYEATIARLDSNGKLTTATDGHQHLVDFCGWDNTTITSGTTSWSMAANATEDHTHAWVRNGDGSITIAESAGHTHELIDTPGVATLGSGIRNDGGWKPPTGSVPAARADAGQPRGATMPTSEKTEEQNRTLEQALSASEKLAGEHKARADQAEIDRDKAVGRADQLDKDLISLRSQIAAGATAAETAAIIEQRTRADALEAKVSRFDETYLNAVRARTSLMFRAGTVMGEDFRMDDMTDDQIRRAVVKRLDSTADVGNHVSEGVIMGQLEQLLKSQLNRARQDARVSAVLGTSTEQNRSDTRSDKMRAYQDQWKQPLDQVLNKKKGA